MKKIIIAALVSLCLVGCTSTGNQSLKNETQESVKTKLIKEKTTKRDVLDSFGEPNHRMVIDGEDRWIYTMYNSQMKATSFIPIVGGLFTGGNDTQTKSLIITFKGEKVSSYEFSSGASEIKNGVF
ncbi:hypothetical protein KP22_21410 [Pectobacterium betavasculorum]|uniref:Lipoprotein n=1 Tax=Pectobacterium betavasculorum TaxID=55207 RepID=A0A093R6K5_9GAMM|nr:hypothetical protein [Pectobacterium betavasculorum]KFW98284.1 hypothetical protein KP22_21410 [Pectobacterium betavasculorum]